MRSNLTPKPLDEKEFADELAPGVALLQGQYVIEAHLNSGGFGITYLAKDSLHRRVVIKECFMGAFCRRSNSIVGVRTRAHAKEFSTIVELFVQEARQLARLRHPNIVGVHQVFRDNETAYMALDYVEGRDLLEILEDPSAKLSPRNVQDMTLKLLDAIEFVHGQGILHRDISPDNILLSKNLEPVLIDFGAARETATRKTRLLGTMRAVKDGYSPQEFYLSDAEQHPCSDLYSLGASLYHLMSGMTPPNAQERLAAVASEEPDPYVPIGQRVEQGYSPSFLDAIDMALNVFPKHRIQSAADWRAMITHTKANSATRGSVSRPMLAVDNGNVVTHIRELVRSEQVATEKELQEAGLLPEKQKMPTRNGPTRTTPGKAAAVKPTRPKRPETNRKDDARFSAKGKGSGKSLGLVAAVALLALAGGAGYLSMSGSDFEPSTQAAVKAPADASPAVVRPAPTESRNATAAATGTESPEPAVETVLAGVPDAPRPSTTRNTALAAAPETGTVGDIPEPEVIVPDAIRRPSARPAPAPFATEPAAIAGRTPEIAAFPPDVKADVDTLLPILAEANGVELTRDLVIKAARRSPEDLPAPQIGARPTIDAASPAPPKRSSPAEVIDLASVISGPAVSFPFTVDANDPVRIASVDDGAPAFLRPGLRVVSVNGFPVESLADAQQVLKVTRQLLVGNDFQATLGVEDSSTGIAVARPVRLRTVQETFLLNGMRFRTERVGEEWKTTVVEAVNQGDNNLNTGDEVVALMPASEMIDTPAALARIINRELTQDVTRFNFAVRRGGEMYLVSMNYSGNGN